MSGFTILDVVVAVLEISVLFVIAWGVSRIGSSVEKRFDGAAKRYFAQTTKGLSWLLSVIVPLSALVLAVLTRGINIGIGVLGTLGFFHIVLMATRRYKAAYRFAATELFVFASILGGFTYGIDESGRQLPRWDVSVGSTGFWIWIFGGGALVFLAWMCLKTANDLK